MILKSFCKTINILNSRYYGCLRQVGDRIFIKRLVTADDVKLFTNLTEDSNTLHQDPVKGVVPGAFLNGLVSGVIGTNLFGDGSLVAEQHLKFLKPCYVNTEVTICVSIRSVRKIVQVDFEICTEDEESNKIIFLAGDAKLLAPGQDLQKTFSEYFPPQKEKLSWIQNPFQDSDTSELSIKEGEQQQIDVAADSELKVKFTQVDIAHFWIDIKNECPKIVKRAVKRLMSFVSTYICEKSFSLYTAAKTLSKCLY